MRLNRYTITFALLALIATACSGDEASSVSQSLTQEDGTELSVSGDATSGRVQIANVVLDSPGYVIAYASNNNAPGEVIGQSSLLEAGEHSGIEIELESQDDDVDHIFTMLHEERGDDSSFDPEFDQPIAEDGRIAALRVELQQ